MISDGAWINIRKLVATDIAFFGFKLMIAEFTAGVLICGVLGIFVLLQRASFTHLVLGVYLIALAVNYVPVLVYAIAIATRRSGQAELGQELNDERGQMAKCRRQSLLLLVPLAVPILALTQERQKKWPRLRA